MSDDGIASTYQYVDTAFGGVNRRNKVQRLADVNFADEGAERYITHRRASSALLDWVNTHTNASGHPTIEGFDGPVWDTSLPFDFDDRHDPAQALEWVREFLPRLQREEVPLDALRYYFSGAKGFHVEIPAVLFGGFEPSTDLHVYERAAAVELMRETPFDHSIYDKLRLWRLPNTLNAKGRHYKVRLTLEEILGANMADISTLAEHPRPRLATAPDAEWLASEYLVEVWNRASGKAAAQEQPPEQPAREWSDERGSALQLAAAAAAIAASWPSDPGISRHTDYLLPLAGYLARLMSPGAVAELLKTAARMAGDTNFLEDRTRHWEQEVDRLAKDSAQKIDKGQPVEGLPTISKRWPELADFLATHFMLRVNTEQSRNTERPKGFSFSTLEMVLAEPVEITAHLVENMLPTGGVSIFGAKPKVGKSVMVRNLSMAVARGTAFLGRACQQGTVLYLALEEKRAEVINHFRLMGGVNEAIHLHVGAAPSSSKEGLLALAVAIQMYQPALVVVDPVFKLVRVKDSSDYAELTRELEPVIELARSSGCHIALTHHLGKAVREGGDDLLGSTAIFGAVDTLALMRRLKDNQRTLSTIQRYGTDLIETAVPMNEETGTVALGELVSEIKLEDAKTRVLTALSHFAEDYWPTTEKIRESVSLDRNVCVHALKELAEAHEIEVRGAGKPRDPWQYHRKILGSSDPKAEPAQEVEFPYSIFLKQKEIQRYGNSASCQACGGSLSETERNAGFGLHLDCTLPVTEQEA